MGKVPKVSHHAIERYAEEYPEEGWDLSDDNQRRQLASVIIGLWSASRVAPKPSHPGQTDYLYYPPTRTMCPETQIVVKGLEPTIVTIFKIR
ncbi:MAG: hypothetical protein UX91_C0006G0194 [Candidatus Amesbacteria bacterium GW2011_GWB1_47_19]|nr:MAG: hypothetical protein UW51_C0002G0195 [Candidatus Amesbacteria bacterium GW2011_GWA1_44_24]KKU31214.1 MAG: hypothetical protein UX46_C0006G0006 [Candidatus Amesbacteria bacterium GW2011_GWC1_46_24]KKU67132.1 MAG: hypothetical protein UX91_C0006G0194 [Candidatus Amesbacteria bacterium GW2011_GWB1_47_19]OGD05488.1 MAG: hypothetical protein A2379_00830 [Candidatus Amesbacteria bacterium RIFOXYB1_FULL_47_13]HBC73002.1 hypothetical protein [Candidatus Amesbacteria bacterium]